MYRSLNVKFINIWLPKKIACQLLVLVLLSCRGAQENPVALLLSPPMSSQFVNLEAYLDGWYYGGRDPISQPMVHHELHPIFPHF